MNPLLPPEYFIPIWLAISIWVVRGGFRSAESCGKGIRWAITSCRMATMIGWGLLVMNPGAWRSTKDSRTHEWAILLDQSSSMNVKDEGGRTRWEKALEAAKTVHASKPTTSIRWFAFSDRLAPVDSPDSLSLPPAENKNTDLVSSCQEVLDLYRTGNRPLEGILLISDGRQVKAQQPDHLILQSRTRNIRIHPLLLGGKVLQRDLSIQSARRQYVGFKQRPLKITGLVQNQNLGPISIKIRLLNDAKHLLAEQTVNLPDGKTSRVEFEITPTEEGYREYIVECDAWEGERTPENNRCKVAVSTLDENIRVLYLEGTPGWDSKFIAQALQRQQNIQFQVIYRISQDRYFRISSGSDKGEETSSPSVPSSAEEFRKYDIVILGRGAEYFMSADTHDHLLEFVQERGGCLLFARGKSYQGKNHPLETLEPAVWGQEWEGAFRWLPTATGEDAGLFQDLLPGKQSDTWHKLPSVNQARFCTPSQAFTQVLAEGVALRGDREQKFPVVLSHRMGRGLVILVNSEGLWQWDFFPSFDGASNLYRNFWFHLLQWAVTYSDFLPGQTHSLRLGESTALPNQPISIKVAARPSTAPPVPWALRVHLNNQVVQEFSPQHPGDQLLWEGMITLNDPGTYQFELTSTQQGKTSRLHETLHIQAPPSEKDELSSDPELLTRLARETGGGLVDEKQLPAFFNEIPETTTLMEKSDSQWTPRWDNAWVLLLILFFPFLEWTLRRRAGLT